MARALLLAAAVAAMAVCLVAAAGQGENPEPTNYFPHVKGSKWEYRRTFGTSVKTLAVQVGEVTKGGRSTVVKFTGDYEYLAFEERMEITAQGPTYRPSEGRGDRPLALIRNAARAGQKWDSLMPIGCGAFTQAKATVAGPEDVVVPAGKFKALEVTYAGRVFNNPATMLVWYVDGVGVVKQVYYPTASNIIIELVKYTPGK